MSQPFDLFHQPPMAVAIKQRDAAILRVQTKEGSDFAIKARKFVVEYLNEHGASPGEDITDACKAADIKPKDDRAFGAVYMALARNGTIRKVGECKRRKGHATSGGSIWELTK